MNNFNPWTTAWKREFFYEFDTEHEIFLFSTKTTTLPAFGSMGNGILIFKGPSHKSNQSPICRDEAENTKCCSSTSTFTFMVFSSIKQGIIALSHIHLHLYLSLPSIALPSEEEIPLGTLFVTY
jgi:hypothetical protein